MEAVVAIGKAPHTWSNSIDRRKRIPGGPGLIPFSKPCEAGGNVATFRREEVSKWTDDAGKRLVKVDNLVEGRAKTRWKNGKYRVRLKDEEKITETGQNSQGRKE